MDPKFNVLVDTSVESSNTDEGLTCGLEDSKKESKKNRSYIILTYTLVPAVVAIVVLTAVFIKFIYPRYKLIL